MRKRNPTKPSFVCRSDRQLYRVCKFPSHSALTPMIRVLAYQARRAARCSCYPNQHLTPTTCTISWTLCNYQKGASLPRPLLGCRAPHHFLGKRVLPSTPRPALYRRPSRGQCYLLFTSRSPIMLRHPFGSPLVKGRHDGSEVEERPAMLQYRRSRCLPVRRCNGPRRVY